jgi:hypothetical protein
VQYENLQSNASHQPEEQVNSAVSVMQLFNNFMFPNLNFTVTKLYLNADEKNIITK